MHPAVAQIAQLAAGAGLAVVGAGEHSVQTVPAADREVSLVVVVVAGDGGNRVIGGGGVNRLLFSADTRFMLVKAALLKIEGGGVLKLDAGRNGTIGL